MNRETVYDDIYDAQRHFRTILDAMARPGKINKLSHVALDTPPALSRGAAYVALALLNGDVAFHLSGFSRQEEDYIRANTACRPAPAEQADFLFLFGTGASDVIESAKVGLPAYPDTGATVVIQVGQMGKSSATGGLQLTLTGPGIETQEIVFVTGLRAEIVETLRAKNTEFPLGVDAILVAADECVLCLPRTTKVVGHSI